MKVVSISLVVFLVGLFFADQKLHLFSTVNQTFGQLIQNTTDITTKFLSGAYGVELANAVGTAPYQNVNSDVYISGNTGIGVVSPGTKLDISGTARATQLVAYGSTGTDIVKIQPGNDSNPSWGAIVVGNAAWTSYPFVVTKAGAVSAVNFKPGSSVGALTQNWFEWGLNDNSTGTGLDMHGGSTYSDYTTRLYRAGGDNGALNFENRGTGGFIISAVDASSMYLKTNNTTRIEILSDGRIGLNGVTNPRAVLEVPPGSGNTPAGLFRNSGGQAYGTALVIATDGGADDGRILFSQRNKAKQWSIGGQSNTGRFSIYENAGDGGNFDVGGGWGTERLSLIPGGGLALRSDNGGNQGMFFYNSGYGGGGWIGAPYHGSTYIGGNTYWNGSSWQKIDGGNGTSMLAITGSNYWRMVWCAGRNDETAAVDCEVNLRHNDTSLFEHGTATGSVDVAEYYLVEDGARMDQAEGDLIEVKKYQAKNKFNSVSVQRSQKSYSQNLTGVISTKPGVILGDEDARDLGGPPDPTTNPTPPPSKNPSNSKLVALTGRIPTKVTSLGGNVEPGDSITSSPLAGIGMKATKAGQIVAKALDSTNHWNEKTCPTVSSLDDVNWPEDDGTNPEKPCFRLPDGTYIGKIMTLLTVSWYDPDVNLTSTKGFTLSFDTLKDSANNIVTRTGAFAEIIVGKIKAGVIETKKLIVNGVDILEKLNTLSQKVESQQKEIEYLKQELQQLKVR